MTASNRHDDDDDKPVHVTESFSLRDVIQIAALLVSATVFVVIASEKAKSVEAVMAAGFAAIRTEIASLNTLLSQHIVSEEKVVGTLDERQRRVLERLTTIETKEAIERERKERDGR